VTPLDAAAFSSPSINRWDTQAHANWGVTEVPFDTDLVWNKWHSHWFFTQDFWVVEATPEELGLNQEPFVEARTYCAPKNKWPYDTTPAETSAAGATGGPHCDARELRGAFVEARSQGTSST